MRYSCDVARLLQSLTSLPLSSAVRCHTLLLWHVFPKPSPLSLLRCSYGISSRSSDLSPSVLCCQIRYDTPVSCLPQTLISLLLPPAARPDTIFLLHLVTYVFAKPDLPRSLFPLLSDTIRYSCDMSSPRTNLSRSLSPLLQRTIHESCYILLHVFRKPRRLSLCPLLLAKIRYSCYTLLHVFPKHRARPLSIPVSSAARDARRIYHSTCQALSKSEGFTLSPFVRSIILSS